MVHRAVFGSRRDCGDEDMSPHYKALQRMRVHGHFFWPQRRHTPERQLG